jgi:hypothetical protein
MKELIENLESITVNLKNNNELPVKSLVKDIKFLNDMHKTMRNKYETIEYLVEYDELIKLFALDSEYDQFYHDFGDLKYLNSLSE